ITLDADSESVRITVRDTGIGIPAEHLPRVFERFYRVDRARSRSSGGTGLGLSLVKHAVERSGGSVTITSEEGRGTTLTMQLPRAV
ncbi:MAG: PAS domain-containing sensor histidine kinase, partial [Actinomycetia bacterium]|nr:PAS domain-containing sensor histidine kinase [Actinomycetes bacterium]